jgi:hypothetical protein
MQADDRITKEFFAAYESRMNRALADPTEIDIEETAAAFADSFVESSPVGVICGANGDEFRAMIPKGYEFYRSIGTTSMTIRTIDTTRLDEYHLVAKVHWRACYEKKDGAGETIDFDVIYLLRMPDGEPKIFAYITGDEQKVLKEHGLIPGEA